MKNQVDINREKFSDKIHTLTEILLSDKYETNSKSMTETEAFSDSDRKT